MATKAYIGTARHVRLNTAQIEAHNDNEEEETSQIKLEPINRDPILVAKYRETIKRFPQQRGKVDQTRLITRANRIPGQQRSSVGNIDSFILDGPIRGRSDTLTETESIGSKETLSQKAYKDCCKTMKACYSAAVYNGLAKEKIIIKHSPFGHQALKPTCTALICNTSVATVDFTGIDAGIQGAVYLADVLKENLYILDLTLSNNDIGSEGIEAICEAMIDNRTLKYLNVAGNKLTETDAYHIKRMLMENTTLKGLNVSHNAFRDKGGTYLAEGIEGNDSLEDIDFSWNHLRQRGARDIINALLKNNTVKRADLSYNGFHDAAELLVKLLTENTTLVYLDLASNRLTDLDMNGIVKGFQMNGTLETFLIGNNPYTAPYGLQLLDIVHKNPENKIKELDLQNQPVDMEFLDLIHTVRESRQLYTNHGPVIKSSISRKETYTDDFTHDDPIMVLMECVAQKGIKLVELFQMIDKDSSQSISKTELREGLQSLNMPMSPKAIDLLMKKLDVDDSGEIDFAELMEGQREYLQRKKEREETEEAGAASRAAGEAAALKNKVTKLIKKRRLAKMALVLDTSTEQMKRVIRMNKELPVRKEGDFVDNDAQMMARIAKSAIAMSRAVNTSKTTGRSASSSSGHSYN